MRIGRAKFLTIRGQIQVDVTIRWNNYRCMKWSHLFGQFCSVSKVYPGFGIMLLLFALGSTNMRSSGVC